MKRILISVCLLVVVAACARLEQDAGKPVPAATLPFRAATQTPPTLPPKTPSVVAVTTAVADPMRLARAVLDEFMRARILRDEQRVRGLMTPALQTNLDTIEGQVPVFQVSNPCWYRYTILDLGLANGTATNARVQIYEHYWSGDNGGGLPDSFEQTIVLKNMTAGWRVDALGKLENQRSQPNEPHGETLSACIAAHTQTPAARLRITSPI